MTIIPAHKPTHIFYHILKPNVRLSFLYIFRYRKVPTRCFHGGGSDFFLFPDFYFCPVFFFFFVLFFALNVCLKKIQIHRSSKIVRFRILNKLRFIFP